MHNRPTLLNSCAEATTAAEARFRIDAPIPANRQARVIALDAEAASIVGRAGERRDPGTRLFVYDDVACGTADGNGRTPQSDDLVLRGMDGSLAVLSAELEGADVVVLVATQGEAGHAAKTIAGACVERGIMTAALVIGPHDNVGSTVSALRRHARVLMLSTDEQDLSEVLAALRA
jgi:hypothetical protein